MKRIATLLMAIVAFASFAGIATRDAKALNPAQTSVAGVNQLTLTDLNYYWKSIFQSWGALSIWRNTGVGLYNPGPYSGWVTACGTSTASMIGNAFYCTYDFSIYEDQILVQGFLNGYGDGAAAFVLAHEYGHHVANLQGRNSKPTIQKELNADCLAGMYFHWGVLGSHLLNYNDYLEARNLIWNKLNGGGDHGTASQRLAWFDYGYDSYNFSSCNRTFG